MYLWWLQGQGLILTEFSCLLAAQKGKQTSTLLVLTEGLKFTELQGQQPHTALTPTKSFKSSSCSLLHWGNAGKHLDPQPGVGLVVAHLPTTSPAKPGQAKGDRVAMRILPTNFPINE